MYGTRKDINEKLKRAFTNSEPLAVPVWSRETVTDVIDEELTDAEADRLLCRIGGVAFYGHAAEGISRHTLSEWLWSDRKTIQTVTADAALLKKSRRGRSARCCQRRGAPGMQAVTARRGYARAWTTGLAG